jgi:translation initiation factor 3 subunit I
MKPILLKGHTRALTYVTYNKDGDLFFSCSKDNKPTLWMSDTGERIGTYDGHNGTVWGCDVTYDSKMLLTASADMSCKMFDVQTGQELWTLDTPGPCRWVQWSEGSNAFAVFIDPFRGAPSQIWFFKMPSSMDASELSTTPYVICQDQLGLNKERIIRGLWTPLNESVLTGAEDGKLRLVNPENGDLVKTYEAHTEQIQDMQYNAEKTLLVTASRDFTSKLFDAFTYECLMTFNTDRPINGAAISPIKLHVMTGGGQDAMSVTTTAGQSGKFEARVFHMVYGDLMGLIKGHFGPINTLAIHPDGLSYISGGEDGYIRLHHFDEEYLKIKDESDSLADTASQLRGGK